MTVNIAGSEQLGNDVAMLTSLRTGALDITANSQGAASGLVPELATLGLPFLFEDSAAAFTRARRPDRRRARRRSSRRVGIDAARLVGQRHPPHHQQQEADQHARRSPGPHDPHAGGSDDHRHLPGAWGATEQIAFSELYVALQQGVVDGQENPLANIASSKIYEVNKYISLSGHKWECNPFLISQIALARLGADLEPVQAAAKEAGDAAAQAGAGSRRQAPRRVQGELRTRGQRGRPGRLPGRDRTRGREVEADYGDFVTQLLSAAKT